MRECGGGVGRVFLDVAVADHGGTSGFFVRMSYCRGETHSTQRGYLTWWHIYDEIVLQVTELQERLRGGSMRFSDCLSFLWMSSELWLFCACLVLMALVL